MRSVFATRANGSDGLLFGGVRVGSLVIIVAAALQTVEFLC